MFLHLTTVEMQVNQSKCCKMQWNQTSRTNHDLHLYMKHEILTSLKLPLY